MLFRSDEGVPWHPTKVPGIIGLVSRNVEQDRKTHHFGRNLERYFDERGIPCPSYIYQGDAVIAHLGAVSMTELQPDDRTILLVCGNGLATSNESEFVVTGQHCQLPDQPPLYPHSEMEDGQYQYLVAGKGLFGVMRRAALAKAQEPGSQIPPEAIREYFATDHDSRRVPAIWETTLPDGAVKESAVEVQEAVGDETFEELQKLARPIMDRGISVLANCVLGTIAWMGGAPSGHGHDVFLEGSVALNPPTLERMQAEVLARLESPVFAEFDMETPLEPSFLPDVRRLHPAEGVPRHEADRVDITMIGALAMAAAEDILRGH